MKTEIKKIGGGMVNTFEPLEFNVKITITNREDLQQLLLVDGDDIVVHDQAEETSENIITMFTELLQDVVLFISDNSRMTKVSEEVKTSVEMVIPDYAKMRLGKVKDLWNVKEVTSDIIKVKRVGMSIDNFEKGKEYFAVKVLSRQMYHSNYRPSFMILGKVNVYTAERTLARFSEHTYLFEEVKFPNKG